MKRVIALLLVLSMVFVMFACAQDTPDTPNNPSTDGAGKYKIGINYFSGGSYALQSLRRTSEQANVAAGGTVMAIDDGQSVEQIVADFENMIQSGCDGLIVWCPVETIVLTIAQMCQDAKIPFVLSDKIPTDPDVIAQVKANPYFAGAVAPANGEYGANAAKAALDAGCTKAIITAPGVGDATGTPRAEGFTEAFEAGGGTILTLINNDGTTDDGLANVEDALVAYPDADVIFGTGSDFGKAALNAVENTGSSCRIVTCDFDETLLAKMDEGKIISLVGDYWVAGFYAGVLLQNFLDGHPLKDANGEMCWVDDLTFFSISPEQTELYTKFWIDEYCYSTEEIQKMFVANNPDMTLDALKDMMYAYSFEDRLNAKLAEGKVTAEELTAVGVTVK